MIVTVVGVSRPRTGGTAVTKGGRKAYRGKRRHWYVYYYDDQGKFRKKRISPVEVPYYGSLIRRRKTFVCISCGKKFRAMKEKCPGCGGVGKRLRKEEERVKPEPGSGPEVHVALGKEQQGGT